MQSCKERRDSKSACTKLWAVRQQDEVASDGFEGPRIVRQLESRTTEAKPAKLFL